MAEPRFPQPTPGYQPSEFTTTVALPALLALVSFGLVSEVATPVVGSVVRLQAHYSPLVRGVKTGGGVAAEGAYPTSIWGTLKRVKANEGWSGLHRGTSVEYIWGQTCLIPYLGMNMLVPAVSGLIMRSSAGPVGATYQQILVRAGIRLTLISLATAVLTLPFTVYFNRAVTHPTVLPASPVQAGPAVLTKHERSSALALYKAPGLFAAVALKAVWSTVVVNSLKALVAVQLIEQGEANGGLELVLAFGTFQALSTFIICPLSVLIVRLSLQKQNDLLALPVTEDKTTDTVDSAGGELVALRGDSKPYTGLYDAFTTVREEEGTGKLYAGWGLTLLSALMEIFV